MKIQKKSESAPSRGTPPVHTSSEEMTKSSLSLSEASEEEDYKKKLAICCWFAVRLSTPFRRKVELMKTFIQMRPAWFCCVPFDASRV